MQQYLIDTFRFNDGANRRVAERIRLLPDKAAALRLFSHLINCQNKWMARISNEQQAQLLDWWDPVYDADELEAEWERSLQSWLDYLATHTDDELDRELTFTGLDGGTWAATAADIALQLNYHSIHHRAQLQIMLRAQGVEPDTVDYIRTRLRKIS
ncbi:DinB family protein [Flaviaesturariibacter terrae]